VIPRRVVTTWWEASDHEKLAMFELVDDVKRQLDAEHSPHGYNVGFNNGAVAGQTVDHLHVHVIPRYEGDVDDPRGGIRNVIPGRGNYLAPAPPASTGPTLVTHSTATHRLQARQVPGRRRVRSHRPGHQLRDALGTEPHRPPPG
jgi:diadenosine tetraphosphate (Ap4A) HIT family hydrolase